MSAEEDDTEKEHEPTQKRLDDARKRGEIARSPDLVTAAGYAGFVLAAMAMGGAALQRAGAAAMVLLDRPEELAPLVLGHGAPPLAGILASFGGPLMPLFLVPGLGALLLLVATRGLLFSPEKLAPKLSRISPIATAKQKFGADGLFEFGKSFTKLLLVSGILGLFLIARSDAILGAMSLDPAIATTVLLRLVMEFLFLVLLLTLVVGGADYLWQISRHTKRQRMSRKDMMDEMKDSDGDPHVKAQRRQRAYDIATNQMLADVAKADVVLVNPTHYAVALKWSRFDKTAPICLAKGVDEIAARIRERAAEAGVPIHSDPPTARALHASVALGEEIRPEHYRAVAAAIRFSEAMRARARARG